MMLYAKPCNLIWNFLCGGMAEWFKAAVLKTVERKFRGFESYSLRHEILLFLKRFCLLFRFLTSRIKKFYDHHIAKEFLEIELQKKKGRTLKPFLVLRSF